VESLEINDKVEKRRKYRREYNRKYYQEKIKTNPERLARHRENNKRWMRENRERRNEWCKNYKEKQYPYPPKGLIKETILKHRQEK